MATLEYYEPFLTGTNPAAGEYTIGVLDPTDAAGDGQNPTVGPTPFLSGAWERQTDAPNGAVQATGLSYLGAPAAGGAQSTTPNSRQRRYLPAPWTSTTVGTFYMGYVVNYGQGFYEDGIEGNDMGYRSTEFWHDDGTFAMGIAYNTYSSTIGPQQQDPRTGRMYADFTGTGGAHQILQNAPLSFMEDGFNHLIVIRFNLSDQPASDSILVYLDPTTPEEPVIAGASLTGIDFTLGAISGVTVFGGSGTFPVYDELRVATTMFFEAIPDLPKPGDTNGDDLVDMADYLNILHHMNLSGPLLPNTPALHPDVTADGKVSIADFRLWKDNRTDLPGAGAAIGIGVPEPAAILLLTIGGAHLSRRSLRRPLR
jgi:hypothetical protein